MPISIAEGLTLPDNAATQVFAFMGRRGSGKTYGAGRLIEQLAQAGDQVVILDPVGVWWGLRLAADGKSPGIAIPVFGGQRGDIPLQATAGKLVAELVAERQTSLVLDVSDFTGADQRRFVADFCGELFHAKKRHRSAVMVVFEEAQEFVPQNVRGETAKMVGAIERLIKLGRNYGIGAMLISQRPQAVNKDVLNLTEAMFAFQLTGPQERKAVEGWVQEKGATGRDKLGLELPSLPVGTAMVWSPQWLGTFGRHRILPKRTFDASATPTGGAVQRAASLAPIDLDQVNAAMAATIEAAKENDPAALRAELADLRRQLAATNRPAPPAVPVVQRVEVPVVQPETMRLFRESVEDLRLITERVTVEVEGALKRAAAAPIPVVAPAGAAPPNGHVPAGKFSWLAEASAASAPAVPTSRTSSRKSEPADGRIPPGMLVLLGVARALHPRRLSTAELAVRAVMTPGGGTIKTYLGRLIGLGYLERQGGTIGITPAGIAVAPELLDLDPRALVTQWRESGKLPGLSRDMLETVAHSREMPGRDLATFHRLDFAGGTYKTYVGKLVGLGLLSRGRGTLRINEALAL